jgi:Leucine-rich repeat (LRR) protein
MAGTKIKLTGFELLELLGQGGMGVVWKARQLSLDRLVAIKLLPAQIGQDPESITQIITEARTAARLKHSGIVQVYDASEENGNYFFVMEYVDGYNVGQWLTRSKVLPWKDALVVAESVALALEYAWQTAGLIHCDIKPENIMVDGDGTIKVADLGLSRTRDSREYHELSDIMGTPAYMSPEQVRGDVPLDCRTDIYALGATLYQMVTGHRLFAGKSDKEVMECMLTDQVPDPRDSVQGLPGSVCALLERMLAKNRDQRIRDWTGVIQEIRRVEKGQLPATKAPPPGASTVNCRKIVVKESARATCDEARQSPRGWAPMVVLLVLLGLAAAAFWYLRKPESKEAAPERPAGPVAPLQGQAMAVTSIPPALVSPQADSRMSGAREALEGARLAAANPRQRRMAVRRLQDVARNFPGTPEATLALREFRDLTEKLDQERQDALKSLTNRVQSLVDRGQIVEALNLLETYAGPWAAELAAPRAQEAQSLRRKLEERAAASVDDEKWEQWLGALADSLLSYRISAAQQEVSAALTNESFKLHGDDLESIAAMLKATTQMGDRVIQSFHDDIGKTIRLKLGRGDLDVTIVRISGRKVIAQMAEGQAEMSFGPEDLMPAERLARIGSDDLPEVALVKGIAAAGNKALPQAEACFARTGPVLSRPLLAKLRGGANAPTDSGAEAALSGLLAQVGIMVGAYDEAAWMAMIRAAPLTREQAAALAARRERFLQEFGSRDFTLKASPVLLLLEEICQKAMDDKRPAGLEPSVASTNIAEASPPPLGGVPDQSAVVTALWTRNPALLNEQVSTFNETNGAGIQIVSDAVLDLGPLSKLRGIRELRLVSTNPRRPPLDIRPLVGSDVDVLKLSGYVIKDLSVLRQLRLRSLSMPGSTCANYAALSGLPLVELDLAGSSIRDLTPLRGMKLEALVLDDTKVSNLAPLAGMPLRRLSLRNTPLRDVSTLRPLPLESLNLAQTLVFDCQPLRGLGLRILDLRGTPVRDLSFCSSMPLVEIDLSDSQITDLSGLKGKSLSRLNLTRTPVRDLSAIEGSSIQFLDLTGVLIPHRALKQTLSRISVDVLILDETSLNELSFLTGSRVSVLSIRNTKVDDLSPLRNMPLRELNFQGTPVTDYGPLETMKLTSVWVNGEWRAAMPVLTRLPELTMINGLGIPESPAAAGAVPGRRHHPHDIERAMRESGAIP